MVSRLEGGERCVVCGASKAVGQIHNTAVLVKLRVQVAK
jgi:hypothetical protein